MSFLGTLRKVIIGWALIFGMTALALYITGREIARKVRCRAFGHDWLLSETRRLRTCRRCGDETRECPNCGGESKIHLYGIWVCGHCELPVDEFTSDSPSWDKLNEAMRDQFHD